MLDSSRPKQQNFEKENVKFFVLRIPFFFVFFFGGGGSISEATYKAYLVDDKSKLFSRYYSELYGKYYGLFASLFAISERACVGSLYWFFVLVLILLSPEVWLRGFFALQWPDRGVCQVCKLFYELSRKNSGYVEKLSHSRQLFKNFRIGFTCYEDICLSFSSQLSHSLMQYVREEDFIMVYCFFVFGATRFAVSEVTIFGHVFALCKDLCSWQKDIWSYK